MSDPWSARAVSRMFPGTLGGRSRVASPLQRRRLVPARQFEPVLTQHSLTFLYTGANQPFTVPSNIQPIPIDSYPSAPLVPALLVENVYGAGNSSGLTPLGRGAGVFGYLPVVGGDVCNMFVGGSPGHDGLAGNDPGWPDGGSGGTETGIGGSGSSSIRLNGTTLTDAVIIAAGCGGYISTARVGGSGGDPDGYDGTATFGTAGTGATTAAGGSTGGGLGQGGSGVGTHGTGGGGGLYGGGAGSGDGSGGGGSSYIDPVVESSGFFVAGAYAGQIVISYWVL